MDIEDKIISVIKRKGRATFTELKKELDVSEPTLSKHLKILKDKKIKLVGDRKDPHKTYYVFIANKKTDKKQIKELKSNKLNIELCRHGIMNKGSINSEVEVLLRISNPTTKVIGINKILVRSEDKDYLIAVSMQDYETGKNIFSLSLNLEDTRMIRLYEDGLPTISMEKKYVPATIEIYNTNKTLHRLHV